MFKSFSMVIVACSFGFFLLGVIGYFISPDLLDEKQIRDNAEAALPEFQTPPKPAGQTKSVATTRQVCTKVPKFKGLKITMKNICHKVAGPPTEEFIGPTDNEMKAWETEVARLQRERIVQLELEIAQIENSQQSIFTAYIKDLIQIGSGLFGMLFGAIGTVVAVRQDRRDSKKTPEPTS